MKNGDIYLFEELEKILNKNVDRYYSKVKEIKFTNYNSETGYIESQILFETPINWRKSSEFIFNTLKPRLKELRFNDFINHQFKNLNIHGWINDQKCIIVRFKYGEK